MVNIYTNVHALSNSKEKELKEHKTSEKFQKSNDGFICWNSLNSKEYEQVGLCLEEYKTYTTKLKHWNKSK